MILFSSSVGSSNMKLITQSFILCLLTNVIYLIYLWISSIQLCIDGPEPNIYRLDLPVADAADAVEEDGI